MQVPSSGTSSCPVVVGNDILDDLPSLLYTRCAAQHHAAVADSHVALTFGERVVAILAEAGTSP